MEHPRRPSSFERKITTFPHNAPLSLDGSTCNVPDVGARHGAVYQVLFPYPGLVPASIVGVATPKSKARSFHSTSPYGRSVSKNLDHGRLGVPQENLCAEHEAAARGRALFAKNPRRRHANSATKKNEIQCCSP